MRPREADDRQWMERLEANRRQLARLAESIEQEAGRQGPVDEAGGDLIPREPDDADFAQVLTDRDTSDRLVLLLEENREQVERALARLAEGRYGYCEDCSQHIPAERLQFNPQATRCVSCQGRWDRLNRRSA
jgi:RNA polymerase-binding transcription factor DksA